MSPSDNVIKKLTQLEPSENRVFVFDIDSTLLDVTPRNQEIVRDFAKKKLTDPEKFSIKNNLENFELTSSDWGIKSGLQRLNLSTVENELLQSIKQHWDQFFFSGDFLHHDKAYPGAVEYLRFLNNISPVYYLTGRDTHRMGKGSYKQLKDHGFPLDKERNKLILKPHKKLLDHEYKLDELKILVKQFEEIHFFENEPVILNTVLEKEPSINLYYIDSVNSGRATINPNIKTIKPYYVTE